MYFLKSSALTATIFLSLSASANVACEFKGTGVLSKETAAPQFITYSSDSNSNIAPEISGYVVGDAFPFPGPVTKFLKSATNEISPGLAIASTLETSAAADFKVSVQVELPQTYITALQVLPFDSCSAPQTPGGSSSCSQKGLEEVVQKFYQVNSSFDLNFSISDLKKGAITRRGTYAFPVVRQNQNGKNLVALQTTEAALTCVYR